MEKKLLKVEELSGADLLIQALPHMQRYDQSIVVIKYGGHAIGNQESTKAFAENIVLLEQAGIKPVVIHGGGPQIDTMLKRMNIPSRFANGLRITDQDTVEIVEMVLAGSINKHIVASIGSESGKAVGLSGKDGNMVIAQKLPKLDETSEDLGYVGIPKIINCSILEPLLKAEIIPVIAPVALGEDGQTYNINADTFAGAIAGALHAKRLLLLTDVPGVLDRHGRLIPELSSHACNQLIADGTITSGMIPKVETCLYALQQGVEAVVILDGKKKHSVLLELFTDHGVGTLFRDV